MAEAVTGRQMPTPKAATEAGLDQEQSCVLFAVTDLLLRSDQKLYCTKKKKEGGGSVQIWLLRHCLVTLPMEIRIMKAIYALLSYLVMYIYL